MDRQSAHEEIETQVRDVLMPTLVSESGLGVRCEYGLCDETRHRSLGLRMRLDIEFITPLRVANIGAGKTTM